MWTSSFPQIIKLLWFFDALYYPSRSCIFHSGLGLWVSFHARKKPNWLLDRSSHEYDIPSPTLPLPFVVSQTNGSPTQVLPQNPKSWYMTWHLIKLNLCLLVPLFSSASVGYDGILFFLLKVPGPTLTWSRINDERSPNLASMARVLR